MTIYISPSEISKHVASHKVPQTQAVKQVILNLEDEIKKKIEKVMTIMELQGEASSSGTE